GAWGRGAGTAAGCWRKGGGFGGSPRERVGALLETDKKHEYVLSLDAATGRAAADFPPADRAARVVVQTSAAAARAASADGRRSLGDLWRMRRAVAAWGRKLDVFYFPADYTYFPIRTPPPV